MREIKFRIWNPGGNNMLFDIENVYDCLKQQIAFDKSQPSIYHTPIAYDHTSEGMVWMQYTGIKDKNGKEIYEGDVLMYIGTNMSSMVVKFDNGCFVGEGPFNTLPLKSYLDATDFESIEIIGNIYENSELSPI